MVMTHSQTATLAAKHKLIAHGGEAGKGGTGLRQANAGASQSATQNQIDQLRYLGYRGPVESKQQATKLITHMRAVLQTTTHRPRRVNNEAQLALFQDVA